MDLIAWNLKLSRVYPTNSNLPIYKDKLFDSFSNYPSQFHCHRSNYSSITTTHAKKKIQPSIIEEVTQDEDEDEDEDEDDDEFLEELEQDDLVITDELDNEEFLYEDDDDDDDGDGDYFEDEYATEDAEVYAGDGAEGGGISLAGTWWDKEALAIAENVTESFNGELGMYAFRTLANARIQVRIEKLSTKSGSPSMSEIEAFSAAYRTRLDEAELAKTIPENIYLEVSSPGVERVIHIPLGLDRFKERPMYIKYLTETAGSSIENDGIFRLVSYDLETKCCTWGLADVRVNREKAGKGRPMNKKMREWRVTTPFESIRLARLYSEM